MYELEKIDEAKEDEALPGQDDQVSGKPLETNENQDETQSRLDQYSSERASKCTFSQFLTAMAVSFISLVIGYSIAYTSPADISLRRDLHIGHYEMSWIGGLLPLGAVLGGAVGGMLIELCGRKGTLFMTNFLFITSWIITHYAENFRYLYVSRCIAGVGTGLATLTLPVYLVETIQPEVRGILGLLPMTFGNVGILICFTLGLIADWKRIATVGVLLALPFYVFFLWIIPETPTWYITRGKFGKGREALAWLRDRKQVTQEYNELLQKYGEAKTRQIKIMNLFKPENFKPLLIVLGLMFFQQFSGINAVIFYTTSIFEATDSQLSPVLCTIIIGIVNLLSTLLASGIICKLGRKMLLQISSILMSVGLGCLGFYYYLKEIVYMDVDEFAFVPLISLVIYITGFALGFGPIPWLMMGELLPVEIKGIAASIATSLNWTCTFIITLTFPSTSYLFGYFAMFWFYCCITIASAIVVWLLVPETRNVTPENLNRQPNQSTTGHVPLKPFPISL